ncbi:hypothetical protein QUF54_00600, partial [Candidatus Marithioploca araucensis]|nr:hypothetical protein [Candidatus Marithioploca araucensis]
VAIAYKQDHFLDRATAAIRQYHRILILDQEQNLILQVSVSGGKIEYQGITFTLKQIRTACNRVYTLKVEITQKLTEQNLAKLLAQIPAHLEAKIKALQQQEEQYWDKLSLLNTIDLKFFEGYKCAHFNFYKVVNINFQTQAQMNDWISAWIERVETAIAAPSLADVSTKKILGLIACSPKYGTQTYAKWLCNSKEKTLENKNLDKTFRAALGNNTIVAIVAKIEAYIDYQWLTIITMGIHKLPVLILTKKGKKVLQRLEQKKIKTVATQSVKVIEAHSHIYWLKQIQQQGHIAYVNFLNTPQSIANIAIWTKDEIVAMQQLLNERLKAWQVLAKWKLSKHPIKYKPLQRLLSSEA